MTGPEHYREAEYLLAQSIDLRAAILQGDPDAGDPAEPDRVVALAQVHATLALAAATALTTQAGVKDWEEWCDVTTVPRGGGRS